LLECKEAAGPTANNCKTTVTFTKMPAFEVKFVRIKYKSGTDTIVPTTAEARELNKRLKAIYPVSDIDVKYGTLDFGNSMPSLSTVNSRLALIRFFDGCFVGCNRFYYGAFDQQARLGGLAAGIPSQVSSGAIRDTRYGRNRHAHEIAHSMGVHHAVNQAENGTTVIGDKTYKNGSCRLSTGRQAKASLTAPEFPYVETVAGNKRSTIGPMSDGDNKKVYGYDNNQNLVIDPEANFAMMSYCPGVRWISKVNYETIKTTTSNKFPSPGGVVIPLTFFRIISGIVASDGSVHFEPAITISSSVTPLVNPAGDFNMKFFDDKGQLIDNISFEPILMEADFDEDNDGDGSDKPLKMFIIPIEDKGDLARAVLEDKGAEIGVLQKSANAPVVKVLYPDGGENLTGETVDIRWEASDIDGDPLSYSVQYSSDNGTHWTALVNGFTETTLEVLLAELKKTDNGLIRVQVSDGWNTAEDESNYVFTAPNSPPDVQITSPKDRLFTGVQQMNFDASVFDQEDDNADLQYQWRSSLNGVFGNTKNVTIRADQVAEGKHEVTLTVTDRDSGVTTKTINIWVSRMTINMSGNMMREFGLEQMKSVLPAVASEKSSKLLNRVADKVEKIVDNSPPEGLGKKGVKTIKQDARAVKAIEKVLEDDAVPQDVKDTLAQAAESIGGAARANLVELMDLITDTCAKKDAPRSCRKADRALIKMNRYLDRADDAFKKNQLSRANKEITKAWEIGHEIEKGFQRR